MATTKTTKTAAAKPETASTEIAVQQSGALAVAGDFMDMGDFGGGFEGVDSESFAIPFLNILQKMSPMVDSDDPAYVQGAKAGMLYNTVTKRLYDAKAGLTVVPAFYKRSFIQWGARDGAEPGFKGEFTPEQVQEMIAKGLLIEQENKIFKPLADGTVNEKKCDYFADTRAHYVVTVDDNGDIGRALLPLSSSQIKASKMLMTSLQQKKVDTPQGKRTPPTFANLVKLSTVSLSNDKGTWAGVSFELLGLVTSADVYNEAKAFYKDVAAGTVKADFSKADNAEGAGGAASGPREADAF